MLLKKQKQSKEIHVQKIGLLSLLFGFFMLIAAKPVAAQDHYLYFDGSNDYVALQMSYQGLYSVPYVSLEAWVRTTYNGGGYNGNWSIVDFDRSDFYNLYVRGDNGRVGFSTDGGNTHDFTGNTVVNDGQWHHIAAIYDGTNKYIYVDGVLDATHNNSHGGKGLGTNARRYGFIGDGSEATGYNGAKNNVFYKGDVSELRIWHRVLSGEEIAANKAAGSLTGTETGLAAYYTFDDGLATDLTGNGYNGGLFNGPLFKNTDGVPGDDDGGGSGENPDLSTVAGVGLSWDANTQKLNVNNSTINLWNENRNNNVFIGLGVGSQNTGTYNVMIGDNAGSANTTASSNTFIGYDSGKNTTTGGANTFIGVTSGRNNTTGNYNTIIGERAGSNNTSGSVNTFIGSISGAANTSGRQNVFMGYSSGFKNTTANNNTFIGYGSGYNTTTGANNTLLGYQAGYNNVTGAGNIFLGYQAGYNETGNNKLYIDNSNTETPLIYGDFSADALTFNGKVGIGTSDTPSKELDVKGSINFTGDLYKDGTKVDLNASAWTTTEDNISFDGNVGIGTIDPKTQLHIYNGNSNGFRDQYASSIIEGIDSRLQLISSNQGSNGSSISLTNENSSWSLHQKTSNDGNRFDIGYRASNSIEDIINLQDIHFSILKTGKIGIGTTTPGVGTSPDTNLKLQVNGGITLNSGSKLSLDHNYYVHGYMQFDSSIPKARFKNYGYYGHRFDDNGGTRMVIEQGGNVGIGTTEPSAALEVKSDLGINIVSSEENWKGNIKMVDGFLNLTSRDDMKFSSPGGFMFKMDDNNNGVSRIQGFNIYDRNNNSVFSVEESTGNVGINTIDTKGFELGVNGKIAATEVKIATYDNWADFVFEKDYALPTLEEVEKHIEDKGHLKNIPSAKEVEKEGFFLGDMNAKLLQKIEELTLYTIQQEKKLKAQEKEIQTLKNLSARLAKLEALLQEKK